MSEKKRMLDLEEVEAALKRAAWAAVHGPPEVRAGRFVVRVDRNGEDKTGGEKKGESDAVREKNSSME